MVFLIQAAPAAAYMTDAKGATPMDYCKQNGTIGIVSSILYSYDDLKQKKHIKAKPNHSPSRSHTDIADLKTTMREEDSGKTSKKHGAGQEYGQSRIMSGEKKARKSGDEKKRDRESSFRHEKDRRRSKSRSTAKDDENLPKTLKKSRYHRSADHYSDSDSSSISSREALRPRSLKIISNAGTMEEGQRRRRSTSQRAGDRSGRSITRNGDKKHRKKRAEKGERRKSRNRDKNSDSETSEDQDRGRKTTKISSKKAHKPESMRERVRNRSLGAVDRYRGSEQGGSEKLKYAEHRQSRSMSPVAGNRKIIADHRKKVSSSSEHIPGKRSSRQGKKSREEGNEDLPKAESLVAASDTVPKRRERVSKTDGQAKKHSSIDRSSRQQHPFDSATKVPDSPKVETKLEERKSQSQSVQNSIAKATKEKVSRKGDGKQQKRTTKEKWAENLLKFRRQGLDQQQDHQEGENRSSKATSKTGHGRDTSDPRTSIVALPFVPPAPDLSRSPTTTNATTTTSLTRSRSSSLRRSSTKKSDRQEFLSKSERKVVGNDDEDNEPSRPRSSRRMSSGNKSDRRHGSKAAA